jgi:hypothetical protein
MLHLVLLLTTGQRGRGWCLALHLIRSTPIRPPSVLGILCSEARMKGRLGLTLSLQVLHKTKRLSPSQELPAHFSMSVRRDLVHGSFPH